MTAKPVRLQLSRKAGFNLQELSRQVNGLPGMHVARPGHWGNPYRVDDSFAPWSIISDRRERARACVAHYRRMAEEGFVTVAYTRMEPHERRDHMHSFGAHAVPEIAARYLRGHNLFCWCGLCERHQLTGKPVFEQCDDCDPCHADDLLEFARRLNLGDFNILIGLLGIRPARTLHGPKGYIRQRTPTTSQRMSSSSSAIPA